MNEKEESNIDQQQYLLLERDKFVFVDDLWLYRKIPFLPS